MDNFNIPTNFKVVGFGEHATSSLESIRGFGYEGLSILSTKESQDITPSDEDKMVILLIMGEENSAAQCAKSFYQAGVLTIAISIDGHHLPEDCVDSQTTVPEYMIPEVVQTLLNIVFNSNGYICLDFHDLDTTLRDSGRFAAIPIHGLGHERLESATADVKDYMESVFSETIENTIVALYFNKNAERPIVMKEVSVLSNYLQTLPKEINIVWGLHHDDTIKTDAVRVAMILSGKEM